MAAVTNHCKLDGLQPQKFIISQFWRPEVLTKGVGKAPFPLEALGEKLSFASGCCLLSLTSGYVFPIFASMVTLPPSLLCVCLIKIRMIVLRAQLDNT